MSFIQRELDRLSTALRQKNSPDRHCQLYAAQQALAWALEPTAFGKPCDVIFDGGVQPISGTLAGSAGCPAEARHSLS